MIWVDISFPRKYFIKELNHGLCQHLPDNDNNDNHYHLLDAHSVTGVAVRACHVLCDLILKTTLGNRFHTILVKEKTMVP